MKLYLPAVLAVLALAFTQAAAQNKYEKHSLAGKKIFIAPMKGDLHPFIAAEIVEKKLPVVVVTDKKKAEYILAGSFIKGDGRWYHTALGVTDENEGSIQLINVKDKTLVWAGGAGDRSLFLGGWSRGGQRKVADRIVNKMKKDLFSHLRTNADYARRDDLSAKRNTHSSTGKRETSTPRP
jgi:hypothetical protein